MFPIIFVLSILLAGCSSQPPQAAGGPPVVPVNSALVEERTFSLYVEALGTLKAAASVEVRSQVDGLLQQIHVKEGDPVAAGEPLMAIDPSTYNVKLLAAQAQLMHHQAALEAVRQKVKRYDSLTQKDLIAPLEWEQMARRPHES